METLTEDYSPGDSFLGNSEEFLWKDKEGDRIYVNTCWGKKKNAKLPNFFTNHNEYTYQVNDFSTCLCIGRCKNLDSLRLYLRNAS